MRPTVLSVAIAMGLNNVQPEEAQLTFADLHAADVLQQAQPEGFDFQFTDADKERMVGAFAKRWKRAQKRLQYSAEQPVLPDVSISVVDAPTHDFSLDSIAALKRELDAAAQTVACAGCECINAAGREHCYYCGAMLPGAKEIPL